jgi:hypothetical protein
MLPFLAALPGIVAAGQGVYNMFQGFNQDAKSDLINPKRKKYFTPGAIHNNVEMYRSLANSSKLPGQNIAENRINTNSANALDALKSSGAGVNEILSGVSQVNANQNNAMADLSMAGAEHQAMNQDKFAQANEALARYKDVEFDYNQNQPYLMDLARKMALKEAGATNINNGLTGIVNAGTSYMGSDLFGAKKTPATQSTPYTGNAVPGLRKYNSNLKIF